ncbi:MAG: MBL fold metallo-hydrolase [Cyclobacteriaceae bacterium]|jgi:L-ascorbate metabolism protein UlaG (beta-lactamase superfamily)|nr:MBL fold metallo-hydrolase [Cyclobacteriaceae bacterium]
MKRVKKIMVYVFVFLVLAVLGVYVFVQSPVFGANPSGSRLERIQQSPRYREGSFQNAEPTEVMLPEASYAKMMRDFFFNKPNDVEPPAPLPSVKTDLRSLDAATPTLVWFGHSSYLIKSKDVSILVDPVFSGNAAPIAFFGKAFAGSNTYQAEDMPDIDVLLLTHDHYDHLDYPTIKKLHPRVKTIVTSLGVGAHLERWGVAPEKIIELDWWEHVTLPDSLVFTATPARHFSGRSFLRGKTAWSSFVLALHGHKLFLGGDSGYDGQFKIIGEKMGPFDLALLEAGQYGANWPYIHMTPEQTVAAAQDLKAKVLMPVHWGKFALSMHAWNEPIERVWAQAEKDSVRLTTPKIGEAVLLNQVYPRQRWWNF